MNSEPLGQAFATLRVVGDALDPDEVTRLLSIRPTFACRKADTYSTGRSKNLVARTGTWLFDTSHVVASNDLSVHTWCLLLLLGFRETLESTDLDKAMRLHGLITQQGLGATLTLFWHGTARAPVPKDPKWLTKLLAPFSIAIETDFDRDETNGSKKIDAA
jgi:hypothetical protein